MKKRLCTILLGLAAFFCVGTAAACATLSGDSAGAIPKTSATIKFDINLSGYETNAVKDKTVSIGKRVPIAKAYVTSENPDNLQLYGWYTDKACTDKWDFKQDRVTGDMTLYAKWVEQYEVNYFVNGDLVKTDPVFKGDTIIEDASLVAGFKYLGTYLDAGYETEFDYEEPIAGDTDLYIQRSEGIYMSDHVEEGELSSVALTDYLVAYIGSYSTDSKGNMVETEGWVEPRTVSTQYGNGTVEEKCTYVNFGYAPKYGDGYIELCLALDITQSQIIRVWFKNLGKADSVNMYFTALLDAENNVYSETGAVYTQDYCYPNYTGSKVGSGIMLSREQMNMDESSEWTYVDFNLYEVYKNGYSVWGTSNFLGMLRFQASYKNVNEDDWSNEFLIKAIEGISHEIVVEDSATVKELLNTATTTAPSVVEQAGAAQAANPQGLVFPKDGNAVTLVEDGAQVFNTVDGLLFYAQNEIVSREGNGDYYGFTVEVPKDKTIDLSELTTLNFTVKNYGYVENIVVRVYNDKGVPIKADLKLTARQMDSKTYTANLYGKGGMTGNLSKIELRYNSIGVDNALLIESIQMTSFVPYDIPGINLNDKYSFGLSSTSDVTVSFDSNRDGTQFDVKKTGATVLSSDRPYDATSDGYGIATLQYYLPKDSNVSAVSVEYKIDGAFTSKYTYALDTENKGAYNSVSLPFKANERGIVKAIRLSFEGTGKVLIRSIDYATDANSLPFYLTYEDVYKGWDWELTNTYQYDSVLKSSVFIKDPTQAQLTFALYIGFSSLNQHLYVPHTTRNVLVSATTKIKIVYQNRTTTSKMDVIAGFSRTDVGNPDEDGRAWLEAYGNEIDCMMEEYEWSTLTIEVPANRAGEYLGKISIGFAGKEIAIRAISIETGV